MTAQGTSAAGHPGVRISGSLMAGIIVVIALGTGLGAWAYLRTVPHPVPIGDVLANLRQYDGTSVTIRGEVVENFNLLGKKWYSLKDESGSIIVVTQRGLPEQGALLTVTGIVTEVFNVGGLNATVLLEPLAPGS